MANERIAPSRAMEEGGAYNRHASFPARGGAFAVPHLESAARLVPLDGTGGPIVIADYGSSQGRNSFAPMRAAMSTRFAAGPAPSGLSLYITRICQRTISMRFSTRSPTIRKATQGTCRTFFRARSGDPSTSRCCRPTMCILDGAATRQCGSAEFPRKFPDTSMLLRRWQARAAFLEQGASDWRAIPVTASRRNSRPEAD